MLFGPRDSLLSHATSVEGLGAAEMGETSRRVRSLFFSCQPACFEILV